MNFAIWVVAYVYYIYIQIYELLKCELSSATSRAMLSDQQNLPNDWYKKIWRTGVNLSSHHSVSLAVAYVHYIQTHKVPQYLIISCDSYLQTVVSCDWAICYYAGPFIIRGNCDDVIIMSWYYLILSIISGKYESLSSSTSICKQF